MSQVKENIRHLKALLPPNIELVAVSKTKSIELILEAYEAGQRSFGENYVQEFAAKQPMLPGDIQWHFIGHLQSNKVRQIAPFVHCIHSIDSEKLVLEVQKQAAKAGRTIKVLLQVHVATEETKFGWDPAELLAFVAQFNWKLTPNVEIVGVMGMASFSEDETLVRSEFRAIRTCFDQLKKETFAGNDGFNVVSMGMSGDWNWAIEEGSTLIRLGSAIFGARN
jgi:PLP dependent protein